MKSHQPQDGSQPFLLRVWKVHVEGDVVSWSGKLQHIVTGDAHLFRDWPGLIALLESNLQDENSEQSNQQPYTSDDG